MWCQQCQREVSADSAGETGCVCLERMRTSAAAATTLAGPHALRKLNDWRLDDELDQADRLLQSLRAAGLAPEKPPARTVEPAAFPARQPSAVAPPGSSVTGTLAWALLSLGVMALVFGGVLVVQSILADRPELWRLGLPFAIGGQAALILGLIFQLESLWRSNRLAATTLDQLGGQIDELQHATNVLSSSHSGPAQSFYLHMAEGASPHLLLADLKGQLDLLATRIGDRRP